MLRLSRAKLTELETFLLVQSDTYSSGVNSIVSHLLLYSIALRTLSLSPHKF